MVVGGREGKARVFYGGLGTEHGRSKALHTSCDADLPTTCGCIDSNSDASLPTSLTSSFTSVGSAILTELSPDLKADVLS